MSTNVKQLEIRQKYQDYVIWLLKKINNFPRKQKFILGEKIGEKALDVAEDIIAMQYLPKEEKKKLLSVFNLKLETLRELMRIAWKMNFLSRRSFIWQEAKIDEVGRMVHGLAISSKNQ
jgi:hypothetical protein